MKRKSIYMLIVLLLLAGCSRTDDQTDVVEQKITFDLSAKRVATDNPSDSELPTGLTAGIYVTDKDSTIVSSYFQNWKYTANSTGTLMSDNGQMLLTAGRNYDVYGYSPYYPNVTNPAAIPVGHGTDVLWAPKATMSNVSEKNNTAYLTFQHHMAQVAFKVIFDPDLSVPSPVFNANSKIQISGFYGTGTLNATTGVITPAGEANIMLSAFAEGKPGAMTLEIDPTMIIPTDNMTFEVQVLHGDKMYKGSINVTPIAGNLINYSVVISGAAPKDILGFTATVEQWVNTTAESGLE